MVVCTLIQVCYLCVCNSIAVVYLMAAVKESQHFEESGFNFYPLQDESSAVSLQWLPQMSRVWTLADYGCTSERVCKEIYNIYLQCSMDMVAYSCS